MRTLRSLLTVAVVLVAVSLPPAAAQAPEKVVFALNWFAVGDHAAYWVALDRGYYKARGLDVELQNSKGSGDSIAKVDTGRADVGLADSAVVIAAVGRGAKIKVVGMVFDKTPLNVWSRKEAPILKRLSDDFELCMVGLNMVRREMDRLGAPELRAVRRLLES